MPHQRHARGNRQNAVRADANNNVHVQHENNNNNNAAPAGRRDPRMQKCCVPGGCAFKEELIDVENLFNAMRVICNNDACEQGNWMHKTCFDEWEETVLAYLRSCGRARSWSEKQRHQNLWTKKGYDLAFKACDCNCGRGHLRKDLDFIPPVDNAPKKKSSKKKTTTKPELNNGSSNARERRHSGNGNTNLNATHVTVTGSPTHHGSSNGTATQHGNSNGHGPVDNQKTDTNHNANRSNGHIRKTTPSITIVNKNTEDRIRANSISSTGSSPPNSASSTNSGSDSPVPLVSSQSPQNGTTQRGTGKSKFEFTENPSNQASLFRKRHDLSAFNVLPKHKQNPYHIKMEDDSANGNDDVHAFVLNHLSSYKMTSLNCVLCKNELSIFDRYPLVDGTLFLSPQAYDNQALQVISEGRLQFINAVCVSCLEGGNDVRCAACKRKWDGSALLLGSMYSYDIFAAMPCCQKRLTCKHCRRAVVDIQTGLPYYSEYSHMIPCPYCKAYDYHFIRPLGETFAMKMSIWH